MNLHILKEGQQIGPLSELQVREGIVAGEFAPDDLAWTEGMTDWSSLESLLTSNPPETPLEECTDASIGGSSLPRDSSVTAFVRYIDTAFHWIERKAQSLVRTAKVGKLKLVDLPKAQYNLGKKAYDLKFHSEQHDEEYRKIAELEHDIHCKQTRIPTLEGASTLQKVRDGAVHVAMLVAGTGLEVTRKLRLIGLGRKIAGDEDSRMLIVTEQHDDINAVHHRIKQIEDGNHAPATNNPRHSVKAFLAVSLTIVAFISILFLYARSANYQARYAFGDAKNDAALDENNPLSFTVADIEKNYTNVRGPTELQDHPGWLVYQAEQSGTAVYFWVKNKAVYSVSFSNSKDMEGLLTPYANGKSWRYMGVGILDSFREWQRDDKEAWCEAVTNENLGFTDIAIKTKASNRITHSTPPPSVAANTTKLVLPGSVILPANDNPRSSDRDFPGQDQVSPKHIDWSTVAASGVVEAFQSGEFLSHFSYVKEGKEITRGNMLVLNVDEDGSAYAIDVSNNQSRMTYVLAWNSESVRRFIGRPDYKNLAIFKKGSLNPNLQLPDSLRDAMLKCNANTTSIHEACDLYWGKEWNNEIQLQASRPLHVLIDEYLKNVKILSSAFAPRMLYIYGEVSNGLYEVSSGEPSNSFHYLLRTKSSAFASSGKAYIPCEYVENISAKLKNGFTQKVPVCEERVGSDDAYANARRQCDSSELALDYKILNLREQEIVDIINGIEPLITHGKPLGTLGIFDFNESPKLVCCRRLINCCAIRWIVLKSK